MIGFAHNQADAFRQLAMDEYLLETQFRYGALRTYQWDSQSVTFGYNLSYQTVVNQLGCTAESPVRRLTAGGLVNHKNDYTFSVVIPNKHPFYKLPARQTYQKLHGFIQEILTSFGVRTVLYPCSQCGAPRSSERLVNFCFKNPVPFDLVLEGPCFQKVLGSAQKRTRKALLFQGTIDKKALPEVNWDRFEKLLFQKFSQKFLIDRPLQPLPCEEILKTYLEKYHSSHWNQKR